MKRIVVLLLILNVSFIVGAGLLQEAAATTDGNLEIVYWQSVEASGNIDMYRAYIKKFPNGAFVDLAKIKIKALESNSQQATAARPQRTHTPPVPSPPPGSMLRAVPKTLEKDELKKMVLKHGFYDYHLNGSGDFKNILRDNKNGTVTDDATGLVWEKVGSYYKLTQKEANRYIDDLNRKKFAGRSDWRLPTVEELASLIDRKPHGAGYAFYIDSIFGNKDGNWLDSCWTSDKFDKAQSADHTAWVVDFYKRSIKAAYWYDDIYDSNQQDPTYDRNYVRAVSAAKQLP